MVSLDNYIFQFLLGLETKLKFIMLPYENLTRGSLEV